MATTRLDRTQVVDTALRLLNELGLNGLTLRRIATELNVQAPALYWHFKNKQELLDEMATEMFRRMVGPPEGRPAVRDWREHLAQSCRGLRRGLLGYRDGAKVFSGTRFTGRDHAPYLEEHLQALVEAGFTPADAVQAYFTAYAFTIGFVIEEQAVYPEPGERDPRYDPVERAEGIGADFPLAAAAGTDLFSGYEERFEAGLRIVLAGIERTGLEAAPPGA
ncbi:TetR/AcrR family transcriptional regulator C-terminal domain-containing protein [Streptomyces sp. NPDC002055]|uniref:TetR/AcrR family transcriptional regulator C-terminal domain-containing protein n=1 Tax=Streptomyces sp. NPDC002055 TaxID=3154534 RepID=UPI003320651E